MSNEGLYWIKNLLSEIHEEFKIHVREHRRHKLMNINETEILEGQTFLGKQARSMG